MAAVVVLELMIACGDTRLLGLSGCLWLPVVARHCLRWDGEKKLNVVMAAVVMLRLMVTCGGTRVLGLSGCMWLPVAARGCLWLLEL